MCHSLVHRYYDPATEQFLSVDPLVNQTGTAYIYAGQDPVNQSDPSGQMIQGPNGETCSGASACVASAQEYATQGIAWGCETTPRVVYNYVAVQKHTSFWDSVGHAFGAVVSAAHETFDAVADQVDWFYQLHEYAVGVAQYLDDNSGTIEVVVIVVVAS